MSNHTAQDLLAAVGVDWKIAYGVTYCPECGCPSHHTVQCRRPSTKDVERTYTGPALGTPELDALLLVEGVKLCRCNWQLYEDVNDVVYKLYKVEIDATDTFALEWIIFHCTQPGHTLAAAIKEVKA